MLDESECDANDGTISFTYTGGTGQPTWVGDNGSTYVGNTNSGLAPGVYNITIPGNGCDLLWCGKIDSFDCMTCPMIFVEGIVDNESCSAESSEDGEILWSASGGTGPYMYTPDINPIGLPAAIYTVTVTDFNGCTGTGEETVGDNDDCGDCEMSDLSCTVEVTCELMTALPTGGVGPYSYLWDDGSIVDQLPVSFCGSNEFVTVTDSNGCTTTCNAETEDIPMSIVSGIIGVDIDCDGEIENPKFNGIQVRVYRRDPCTNGFFLQSTFLTEGNDAAHGSTYPGNHPVNGSACGPFTIHEGYWWAEVPCGEYYFEITYPNDYGPSPATNSITICNANNTHDNGVGTTGVISVDQNVSGINFGICQL